jgi:hypothetical protein
MTMEKVALLTLRVISLFFPRDIASDIWQKQWL